ncbi:uncharacterized protein LOC125665779 isoform X2 [Ostrea edulis]|uniref:uncharacterized protein LOC125665779 isoform X2 n=1 Tax=Ostrea edulis TaxID=37623 RepID=UPI0024AFD744|nr:uncharacterized protein LOC125665779 isoform X2 [Ostrea edulis]
MTWVHSAIVFLYLTYYITMVNSGLCPSPKETVSYVPSCPRTQQEWKMRAQIKNCLHVFQQCSNPHLYVYHCVINSYVNATIEVCAPGAYIIGQHCVEFNILGDVIQENQYASCAPFCPFSYNSTDAFKYQVCYEKTRPTNDDVYVVGDICSACICPNKTGNAGFNFSTNSNKNEATGTSNCCLIPHIVYPCLIFIGICITIVAVRFRYQLCHHLWCKRNKPDDKDKATLEDRLIEDKVHTTILDEEMHETGMIQRQGEPDTQLNANDNDNATLEDRLITTSHDEEMHETGMIQRQREPDTPLNASDEHNGTLEDRPIKGEAVKQTEAAPQLKTDTVVIAIDIGEKFWGLAYSHPKKPGRIIPLDSKDMEKISFLIEDNEKIDKIGKDATEKYLKMKKDLQKYKFFDKITLESDTVNETKVKSKEIFKRWAEKSFHILFCEIDTKFGAIPDEYKIEYVISADRHWKSKRKIMRDAVCEIEPGNMTKNRGYIKESDIFFINKVQTIKFFMHGVKPDVTCFNFDVDNLRVDGSTTYAVLNVGFGSCHLTLLKGDDSQRALDKIIKMTWRLAWDTEDKQCSPESELMDLLFRKIFGITFFEKWISDNPRQKFLLMTKFEKSIKEMIKCDDGNVAFEFKLPKSILDSYPLDITHVRKSVEKIYQTTEMKMKEDDSDLLFECGSILLRRCFTKMKKSVDDVIKKEGEWFMKHNVQSVFIIGGYNTMKLIKDASKTDWFVDKTVTIPTDAGLCYAMGAAYAGLTVGLDLSG